MANANVRALVSGANRSKEAEAGFDLSPGWAHQVTGLNASLRMQSTTLPGSGLVQDFGEMARNRVAALQFSGTPRVPVRRRDQIMSSVRQRLASGNFAPYSEELPSGVRRVYQGADRLGDIVPTENQDIWELRAAGDLKPHRGTYEQLRSALEGE